jgi:hypothetical protein
MACVPTSLLVPQRKRPNKPMQQQTAAPHREFCRAAAELRRDDVLATLDERGFNIPADFKQLLVLDEWNHSNVVVGTERPSGSEAFQQLARVLVTGDISYYRPSQLPQYALEEFAGGRLSLADADGRRPPGTLARAAKFGLSCTSFTFGVVPNARWANGKQHMPFWIEGWLEVRRVGQAAWSGVLSIGPLVDVGDEISERLFGLSKRWRSTQSQIDAVAADRGVPSDASQELRAELAQHAAHERQFGPGEFGGYTHATWNELADLPLDATALAKSDLKLVLDIARQLAADERFQDGVRIVVWFNW